MQLQLYTSFFKKADEGFLSFITSTASSIISSITPAVTVLLSVYIMLWGWSMMRGVIEEPITDGVTRIVRLSIIVGIALSVGRYASYISDWVWQTPDALAQIIAGEKSTSSVKFLDTMLDLYFDLGKKYHKLAEEEGDLLPDLGLLLSAFALYIAGILITGYCAFLFLLSKCALAILLAVGTIFIALSIFEATKKFTDAWIGQTLNFVFLMMLAAAACKLILKIMETYFQKAIANEPTVGDAMQLIALTIIGFLVLMQTPSIASGLAGGAAISTLGAIGASWSKIKGAAKGSAQGSYNLLSGRTLANMRQERRRKATMASWAKKNPGLASRAASRLMNKNSPNKVEKG